MRIPYKISFALSVIACVGLIPNVVWGKDKISRTKKNHSYNTAPAIGFKSGRELLFNSTPLLHSKQSKVHYAINKSLVLRKPVSDRFSIEAGVNYVTLQNTPFNYKFISADKPYSMAIPATIQYFFVPGSCRVRPYCGAGFQGTINSNTISPFNNGDGNHNDNNLQPGTKYISILFTQGITFEINTKIQVSQSFHFIPIGENKVIGIDLGINYKLP